MMQHFKEIEVHVNSETADNSMAQFVYGVDILQEIEVASTVSDPVLLIPVLIRPSMCTFVSL